eukprot:363665-Chlamydomonas_euryale.AAC.7
MRTRQNRTIRLRKGVCKMAQSTTNALVGTPTPGEGATHATRHCPTSREGEGGAVGFRRRPANGGLGPQLQETSREVGQWWVAWVAPSLALGFRRRSADGGLGPAAERGPGGEPHGLVPRPAYRQRPGCAQPGIQQCPPVDW